jgi:hypothetical protein
MVAKRKPASGQNRFTGVTQSLIIHVIRIRSISGVHPVLDQALHLS